MVCFALGYPNPTFQRYFFPTYKKSWDFKILLRILNLKRAMQEINKMHFHRNQLVRTEATLVWSSIRTESAEEIWQRNILQHINKSATPHQGSESNTIGSQLRCHVKPALRGIWSWVSLGSNNSNQLCDAQTSLGKWSNEWVKSYLQKLTKQNKQKTKKPTQTNQPTKILTTEKCVRVCRSTYLINLCKEAVWQKCMKLKYKPACILLHLEVHNILATVHSYNYNFACWQNL